MASWEIKPSFSSRDREKIENHSLKYKDLRAAQGRDEDAVRTARAELNQARISLIEGAGDLDSDPIQIDNEARRIATEPIMFAKLAAKAEGLIRENEAKGIGLPR